MNMHKKRIARRGAAFVCAFGVALSAMPVHAAEVKSLEDKTSNLQSQLEGINQDLVTISNKIAETEAEIEESNNEVYRLEASLQISRNNEEKQYETMKTRIKYMYENGSETMITMLFTADSMGDFLNKAEFIQNITDYDKEMLENMMEIRQGIETQEEDLKSQQQELTDLQSQLNTEQQNLQAKAAATSTDLATVNAQLQAAREAEAKQEEEAQKKAQEEAAKQASASTGNNTSGSSSNNNSSSNLLIPEVIITWSSSSHGKYNIPSGGLTPSKGESGLTDILKPIIHRRYFREQDLTFRDVILRVTEQSVTKMVILYLPVMTIQKEPWSRHLLELEKSMIVEVEKVILICIPTGRKRRVRTHMTEKLLRPCRSEQFLSYRMCTKFLADTAYWKRCRL